jgi:general nucleoside transport system ATP-binding protein
VAKASAEPGERVLGLENVVVHDDRGQIVVDSVSLEVLAGEILCIAGVQGNGQTELMEAIAGLRPVASGTIAIGGRDITSASPREILRRGVADVPEDRQAEGLIIDFSIADNLVLNTFDESPFARWIVRNEDAIRKSAEERARAFDVRTSSVLAPASTLSGGNQQKVIIAREFSRPIELLIASQPTRGLDVGSIEYIHERIVEKRDQGVAVLIVSVELDEVMALADRIAVMYRGRIAAIVPAGGATREELGLLMAGGSMAEAAGE